MKVINRLKIDMLWWWIKLNNKLIKWKLKDYSFRKDGRGTSKIYRESNKNLKYNY